MSLDGDWIHNRFFPQSASKPDPLTCFCGKPALYRVKTEGFCKQHRDEAERGTDVWNQERSREA